MPPLSLKVANKTHKKPEKGRRMCDRAPWVARRGVCVLSALGRGVGSPPWQQCQVAVQSRAQRQEALSPQGGPVRTGSSNQHHVSPTQAWATGCSPVQRPHPGAQSCLHPLSFLRARGWGAAALPLAGRPLSAHRCWALPPPPLPPSPTSNCGLRGWGQGAERCGPRCGGAG